MNYRATGLLFLVAPLVPAQDEGTLRAEVERRIALPADGFTRRDCQRLVQDVVKATALPLRERFDLLERLRAAVRPVDAEAAAYAAQGQAGVAFQLNEFATAVELCKEAAGSSSVPLRVRALDFLFKAALQNGDLVAAWPYLDRYAESASPLAANLARCELLLRVGMIRAASVVLEQIERAGPAGKELLQCRCLRLEELLATEQFEDARSSAEAMLGAELPADVKTRVLLSRAFATARLGLADEAEAMLRQLLGDGSTYAQYLPRIRADLALLRLGKGDAPAVVAALLGDAADSPPGQLGDWSLAARSRLELLRWRAGERDRLQELHGALQARHEHMLQQWRSTPELSAGVAFLQWSVRRELMVCLCAAEMALGGEGPVRRCLDHLLAADACGSLARRHGLRAGSHDGLRRVLPPGGVLLWFLPAPCGSAVFAITQGGEQMLELPPDVLLRNQVRALREQIVDETRLGPDWAPALAGLTQPLGDWLWQPGLRELLTQKARVTVLGRELLTGLPFEFLPSPTDARPLGLTHAIDYVPSATLAVAALARGAERPRSGAALQVLAATELDAATAEVYGDCAVPLTEAQLHEVAAAVDQGRVGVARAVDAAALRTACEAECLVVFAHGRRRHPRDGAVGELARHRPLGIVLRDGFFGVERLEGLARVPSIVVLASCGTARSGVDRGEDGQQFGAAWLAAGARCVLSAEGDLELAATLQLVREFIGQLTSGVEPAEALRRARVAVASQKGQEHPALSCALRLDRSAEAFLLLPARSRSWLALVLALGGAAAAGLWLAVARQKRRGG